MTDFSLPTVRGTLTEARDLSSLTWMRVGGPADVLFQPADEADLADFLAYHADPVTGIESYIAEARLVELPGAIYDWTIMEDGATKQAIIASYSSEAKPLSQADIDALIAFLSTLKDETSLKGRLGIPDAVPSGLPIDR